MAYSRKWKEQPSVTPVLTGFIISHHLNWRELHVNVEKLHLLFTKISSLKYIKVLLLTLNRIIIFLLCLRCITHHSLPFHLARQPPFLIGKRKIQLDSASDCNSSKPIVRKKLTHLGGHPQDPPCSLQ